MIKNVAFHKDKVIIIDDKDSVTVIRVYESTSNIKDGEYVIGIVHVDIKKTTNWYHIYDNSYNALEKIANELNYSFKEDINTQNLGKELVNHINKNKKS